MRFSVDLDVPLYDSANVVVGGKLFLRRRLSEPATIQCSEVRTFGLVAAGSFQVQDSADFTEGIVTSGEPSVIVVADRVKINKRCSGPSVIAREIDIECDASRCDITASGSVHATGDLSDCKLDMGAEGSETRLCVGPLKGTFEDFGKDVEEIDIDEMMAWPDPEQGGAITGSDIRQRSGQISATSIATSSISTDGTIWVADRLDASDSGAVAARQIRARSVTATSGGTVGCTDFLLASRIAVEHPLSCTTAVVRDIEEGTGTVTCNSAAVGSSPGTKISVSHAIKVGTGGASAVEFANDGSAVSGRARGQFSGHIGALVVRSGAEAQVKLDSGVRKITVERAANLILSGNPSTLHIDSGVNSGDIEVDLDPSGNGILPVIALGVGDNRSAVQLHVAPPDADDSGIAVVLEEGSSTRLKLGPRACVIEATTLAPRYQLKITGEGSVPQPISLDSPLGQSVTVDEVTVAGALDLALTGSVKRLVTQAQSGSHPTLSLLNPETAVERATGSVVLGQTIQGRLHGDGLVLAGCETLADGSGDGRVLGADPTAIPQAQLGNLGHLGIFDPDAHALVRYARRAAAGDDRLTRQAEYRSRAETVAQIMRTVENSAISGNSRSAGYWALARLHHQSLPQGFERRLRWAHRFVGYSQRPLPPLALWAFLTCAAALAAAAANPHLSGLADLLRAFVEALLLPFSILRLYEAPDALFAVSSWWAPLLNTAVLACLSLSLLYFLIALRHFLASPGDG